jgi:cytochrome bd-type quinol oxidase subunit 2
MNTNQAHTSTPPGTPGRKPPLTTAATSGSKSTQKASRYAGQVSGLLLAAFALSAVYTVWSTARGSTDGGFSATEPGVWAFYAAMLTVALLVRTDRLAIWGVLAVLLPVLLGVGIFVYPTVFTPQVQTPFGWFENDVYLGLLMVASYLTVQRLRRRRLTP